MKAQASDRPRRGVGDAWSIVASAITGLGGGLLVVLAWLASEFWSLLLLLAGLWLIARGASNTLAAVRVHGLIRQIHALAAKHIEVLMRKRQIFRTTDDYGRLLTERWEKELDYFLDNVVLEDLDQAASERLKGLLSDTQNRRDLIRALDQMVADSRRIDDEPVLSFREDMDPLEYEQFCAQLLRQAGWTTRVTQASGDQGVDVIAEKDGKRVALRVKLYSSPVGNKAVQEAYAGRAFEKADHAAVVTNNSFTTSARELAAASAVLLLHHDDLAELDHRVG